MILTMGNVTDLADKSITFCSVGCLLMHPFKSVLLLQLLPPLSLSFFTTALINDQLLGRAMSPSSQTQCSSFFKNVKVCQQLLHRGNKNPWERSGVPWIQKV